MEFCEFLEKCYDLYNNDKYDSKQKKYIITQTYKVYKAHPCVVPLNEYASIVADLPRHKYVQPRQRKRASSVMDSDDTNNSDLERIRLLLNKAEKPVTSNGPNYGDIGRRSDKIVEWMSSIIDMTDRLYTLVLCDTYRDKNLVILNQIYSIHMLLSSVMSYQNAIELELSFLFGHNRKLSLDERAEIARLHTKFRTANTEADIAVKKAILSEKLNRAYAEYTKEIGNAAFVLPVPGGHGIPSLHAVSAISATSHDDAGEDDTIMPQLIEEFEMNKPAPVFGITCTDVTHNKQAKLVYMACMPDIQHDDVCIICVREFPCNSENIDKCEEMSFIYKDATYMVTLESVFDTILVAYMYKDKDSIELTNNLTDSHVFYFKLCV